MSHATTTSTHQVHADRASAPSTPSVPPRPSIPARISQWVRPSRAPATVYRAVPSLPPPAVSGQVIRTRTPKETQVLTVLLVVSMLIFSVFYWDTLGVVNQSLVILLNILLLVAAVDYFQKIFEFHADRIRKRIWFVWRDYPLPESFFIRKEPSGTLLFIDESTNDPFLVIGRQLADTAMLHALAEMYQFSLSEHLEIQ